MTQYGQTGIVFGVPALNTGWLVQSYGLSSKPALMVSVPDESGVVKYRRYDDITTEVSLTMVFAGGTLPVAGNTFVFNGTTFEVQSVDAKRDNKGVLTYDVKGLYSQGV
jgi:hypothetical protein